MTTASRKAKDTPQRSTEYLEKQQEIQTKARSIFIKFGYKKTSIEDIGKACGLGKAALYHYFSNKEALFLAVIKAECDALISKLQHAVDAVDNPKEKLIAMLQTSFQFIHGLVNELVNSKNLVEFAAFHPKISTILRQFFDEEFQILHDILETGINQGVFKDMDLTTTPWVLTGGLRGLGFLFFEFPDPPKLEASIDSLLNLFLDGICKE